MGLLDYANEFLKGGAPVRKGITSLLQGDTSMAGGLLGEVKQLFNPEYMKQVKGTSQSDMMDVALNANPMMAGTLKNIALNDLAKSHFGTTFRPQETGFILDDGTRLDLSGRHEASGYIKQGDRFIPEAGQTDYLKNERSSDHRSVNQVMPNSQYGWDALAQFIDQTGAVRYMPDSGVSMVHTNKPSQAQISKIVNDYNISGDPLYIDIDHMRNGENLASGEFNKPNLKNVNDWINQQYGLLGDIK